MIKMICCLMVITASVLYGMLLTQEQRKEIKRIEDFISLCDFIMIKTEFQMLSMDEMILSYSQINDFDFTNQCRDMMGEGCDFHTAWRKADSFKDNGLSKYIDDFGKNLGIYDSSGQMTVCKEFKATMEKILSEKTDAFKNKSRTNVALSASAGMTVVLLII